MNNNKTIWDEQYDPIAGEEIVKLFTGPTFDNAGFAYMLRVIMGVRAIPTTGGVLLDRAAFNRCKLAYMPVWAYTNMDDINSEFHTAKVR